MTIPFRLIPLLVPSAARGGADRLELCANLGLGGGTTPSLGLLKAVQQTVDGMPIMVCESLSRCLIQLMLLI